MAGGGWRVARGAWRVARGAWRVAGGGMEALAFTRRETHLQPGSGTWQAGQLLHISFFEYDAVPKSVNSNLGSPAFVKDKL